MNSTEIKKQYVINGKTFDNLQDAEKYQDRLKVKNLNNYPTSSFDEIVYYKIFTRHGDRFNKRTKCNGTFSSTADAYNEMQNHANDKRPNGTGWMDQITITKEADGTITTRSKTIYENIY